MKKLFFLGNDFFKYDILRLAKFYKEKDFFSEIATYLHNKMEKKS